MKKIVAAILCAVLVLSIFAGCTSSYEEASKRVDIAQEAVEYFINCDFQGLRDLGDENFQINVSDELLYPTYQQYIASQEFKSDGAVGWNDSGLGGMMVTVEKVYAIYSMEFSVNFNSKDEIIGFFVTPKPLHVGGCDSDDFFESRIKVGADSELEGIATVPRDVENPPVVIFVSGSGAQGMDGNIGYVGNDIAKDIAHELVKYGIATIRYNDRTYQDIGYAASVETVQDEVLDDLFAVIEFAENCDSLSYVNHESEEYENLTLEGDIFGDVYILGHSQGGMLAPYVAENSEIVDGFISLAGSPRTLQDIIYMQNQDALSGMGLSEEEIKTEMESVALEVEKANNATENGGAMLFGVLPEKYIHSLNQVTGNEVASNINKPALILQGGADFQVSVEDDYKLWQLLCESNENVTFKLYDNLNHLFMPTNGIADVGDYDTPNEVDVQVAVDIAEFINKNQ